MRERAIEVRVGMLIVAGVALFIAFIFVLGNFSLHSGYTLYVDYDFSGNVQAGAPVKVSGIKVGRVEEVQFLGGKVDPKTGRRVQVRVELWVEDRVKDSIRRDAEFFINTAGVLGEQYVEIVPGRDWEGPALAPDAIVVGVNPPRTDLIVSRLFEVLDAVSIVLRDDREKISGLISNSANAVDQVNQLLVENRPQIGKLLVAVTDLSTQATKTLGTVNAAVEPKMIAQTLRDADNLLVTADHTLQSVAPSAQGFLQDATRVTSLVTEDRLERAVSAVDKAADTAGKAGGLISNVDGLVTDLRAGKGTAGALLARNDLYADIRELVRDLRRNPWKVFWKE
jgi:phospholipid/cholesterol/gamma-HCH transport system substrate-binding protein